ncbi:Mycothiol acetyltransferase [Enhygromyxa salina]|uniref:Mycothiol acetyltransferase n=1 Tax=Enhygromyxa salina TaxID=215803 RepID=A0A2S9XAZ3_9BACT|nr:GNAT family N-acetyltransferase [Enhygromyxa salina]PRP90027.1 Mycothiol acetyltransferase [Enhygromyxa salina]
MDSGHAELSAYSVRLARPNDVAALARVHVASWHHAYRGIIAPHNLAHTNFSRSVSRFRGYFWGGGQSLSALHVLEGEGGVLGYVNSGLSNSRELGVRGEVYELYLHPDAHGRGCGRKLLSAGLWALSGRRLLPAVVWVLAENHPARRFYERMRGREIAQGEVTTGDQVLAKVAYVWVDYLPWPEWTL